MGYLKTRLAIAAFIAGAFTPAAYGDRDGSRAITHMDTDGDGLVSFEEFRVPEGRRQGWMLEKADLDGDGAVTLEEATQARDKRMAEHQEKMAARKEKMAARMAEGFAKMDADGDGAVTREEMRRYAFDRIDKDKSGSLSADEFKEAGMYRRKGHHWDGMHQRPDRY